MRADALYIVIAAIAVASLGLWWFRLVLPAVRKMAKTTRYGVYAAIWLAYFILTVILVGQAQQ